MSDAEKLILEKTGLAGNKSEPARQRVKQAGRHTDNQRAKERQKNRQRDTEEKFPQARLLGAAFAADKHRDFVG